jgi:hypothetical protein
MNIAEPKRQVRLSFDVGPAVPGSKKLREFRSSLSALLVLDEGRTLLVGGDETVGAEPSIERLSLQPDGSYAEHRSLSVSDFIELPDDSLDKGRVGEIDIEGMDEDAGYLWFTGSHCCNRKRPDSDKPAAAQIEQLSTIGRGKNRFLLGRIPIAREATGSWLKSEHEGRHATRLKPGWLKKLRSDPHLGLFLNGLDADHDQVLPSKDNGLDIEGLSATKRADGTTRLLLGLRGPVLRGFAMVLELCPGSDDGPKGLELETMPGDGTFYRKHFLDLAGLGVRDLELVGEDLWILAGPTMALDGPVALFRWRTPFAGPESGDTITHDKGDRLRCELLLPFGKGKDHAESFALLDKGTGVVPKLMVVYDSPDDERLVDPAAVKVDVFEIG